MNENQQLTIQFNNGTTLEVAFPKQIKNSSGAVMEAVKRVLESDKLTLEADGRLIVIPWASVQHVEMTPCRPPCRLGRSKVHRLLGQVPRPNRRSERAWPFPGALGHSLLRDPK